MHSITQRPANTLFLLRLGFFCSLSMLNTACFLQKEVKPVGTIGNKVPSYGAVTGLRIVPGQRLSERISNKTPPIVLRWPLKGRVTSQFGPRWGRQHAGIDIAARQGTAVFAAADGRVLISRYLRGYGKVVAIEHRNSYVTVYAHNSKNIVKIRQRVKRGQKIAEVGKTGRATGAHLHFEVRRYNKALNPISFLSAR